MNLLQTIAATDNSILVGVGGLAFLIIGILLSIFWIWMLIDCVTSSLPSTEKLIWFLVIFFLHILGAALYYIMVRSGNRTKMA